MKFVVSRQFAELPQAGGRCIPGASHSSWTSAEPHRREGMLPCASAHPIFMPNGRLGACELRPSSKVVCSRAPFLLSLSRPTRRPQAQCATCAYTPFPFDLGHYYRTRLEVMEVPGQNTGFLMFTREEDWSQGGLDPSAGAGGGKVLVMNIGGDTYQSICTLLRGHKPIRPLSVDLLWSILERGHEISKREWSIRYVAVVGTTQSTFLGRIFFGFDDEESDAIAWDVDCRPSDACWLALKTGAPVLVHRAVWESNAEPLSEMGYVVDAATGFETGGSKEREAGGMFSAVSDGPGTQQLDVAALTTTVLRSDPEPVKLLKLQMRVALSEEDYATAARIRDCAVMRMHVAMKMATREGDMEAAAKYERQLRSEIEKWMR